MKETPLISVIALNWNTTAVTCEFLHSIGEKNTYKNIEVIVVDNNSAEDPSVVFATVFPAVKMIRNEKNLGFSGGNNVGIKAAKGDFLFIVNNDTEFTPGLLEGLLDIFKQYPDAGVACPKFHYFFHKGTIEYAGYQPVNIFTGRNGMVGCREKDSGQYDEVKVTSYAHGGGMMVSREVIEKVGAMPEEFFLYYEEFDWCEQIKRKGYKIYYQPKALIYHKESMTTGKASTLKTYYLTRNRILFMRRNMPLLNLGIFLLYFVFFTVPKNTAIYLVKGQKDHLMSFWKGVIWHFNPKTTFN
ncbi:MAG TPA: glycosyltransferase family 2 protein [Chitinophagaceae bacterium]|nr:glycosyltransferase family 2 protein [Chitinophagaceae bacterium]